ncbi:unnamed protein product [Staurois parvus]|uniref:Uncharacterized protein n=1 Tax=Staurois parvus TaxID=386267 RepID=A0ABN9CNF5_9NEOB|nr:unnamed protein product [Staurois parvus]
MVQNDHAIQFQCTLTLGSHLCGWCRCGSARKSVQAHHPHRGMWTRGRVPLVLMARHPHWKTATVLGTEVPVQAAISQEVQELLPCVSWSTGVHSNEWALIPEQNAARTATYM